jgi:4-hydroxybenzoate polyprenyltransferase
VRPRDALVLGRVSNLPTVWSNTLAGWALAAGTGTPAAEPAAALPVLAVLLAALSLLYVAGMYLNDAFDAAVDGRERPGRPIPAGRVAAGTVAAAAVGMIGLALALLAGLAGRDAAPAPWAPFAAGIALAVAIVAYDAHHKGNRFSPVVMGLCRALVYVTAAVAFAPPGFALVLAAAALWSYLIGLTYAAKEEAFDRIRRGWPLLFLAVPFAYAAPVAVGSWLGAALCAAFAGAVGFALYRLKRRAAGDVPRAVAGLLAALCLFDALVIAGQGAPGLALGAALLYPVTLALQRVVPAT